MANRLKKIRYEKMLSQSELSRMSGISRQTIIRIETYPDKGVNSKTMFALAKALDVPVNDIFFPVAV